MFKDILLYNAIFRDSDTGVYVKLGAHSKYSTNEGAVVIRSNRIFIHPGYDVGTFENDFALIRLSTAISFNDNVNIQN